MIDEIIGMQCTGCTACKSSCPKSAIVMCTDKEGFVYPKVDYNKCVKCGLCEKKCPVLHSNNNKKYQKPRVYAAWNLDDNIRINSTSGGIFSALAKVMISQGAIVVGAQYDIDFNISHVIIKDFDEISKLRQSKYAQSNLGDVFIQIKKLLERNEKVLFCGTPCQSAGLQSYLGKEYSTLYCCDFICRGVISPKVYKKFLKDISQEYVAELSGVHFKNKDFGWNQFSTKLIYSDGNNYQEDRNNDYYMRGYLRHNLYLRPSCHQCCYKTIPRKSDMSLGDFWGIARYKLDLDNDKGTSVILVNSDKGMQLLNWIREEIFLEERSLEEVIEGNSCLLNSAEEGKFRSFFFDNIDKYSFKKLIMIIDRKSESLPVKQRILRRIHLISIALKRNIKY